MSGIVKSLSETYNHVIYDLADPRTQDWWGVSSPLFLITTVISYLYFCTSLGPRLMKDRPPFQLKGFLVVYNFFQVIFSLYIFFMSTKLITNKEFNFLCYPIDYSNTPYAVQIAGAFWFYYFGKFTELVDTVLFVLRKKWNQVSFLHVYHHSLMFVSAWLAVKYFPGGSHPSVMGYMNVIVHIFMYTYYMISAMGPKYEKYIWWKKHLTLLQLVQFVIIFVHNFSVLFYDCNYPKLVNILFVINSLAFLNMFGRFYLNSYTKDKAGRKAQTLNGTSESKAMAEKSR